MKHHFLSRSGAGALLLAGLLLVCVPAAFAQDAPGQSVTGQAVTQQTEVVPAEAVKTAPAPAAQGMASPALAGLDSAAAFDEAQATAKPAVQASGQTTAQAAADVASAPLPGDANQTAGAPDKPSYGNFLEHKQEPKSTDIMATGDSLISSVVSMAAYLCLILGIIFLGFWLLRKFGPRGIARGGDMVNPQLVGRLMLGQKKHLDVVRVQGRTLLLGVTDESINLLTELETQPGQCFDDEDEDEFTNFTEMLGKQTDNGNGD